jgi:polyisoprenoid-binding protein YceI
MHEKRRFGALLLFLAPALIAVVTARAESRPIDTEKSVMTVRVYKSGVLSAFGHDHEIAAPIAAGTVDASARHVELRIRAASLRVRDTKGSEKDHAEIQKTMLGPDVLDSERYAEIVFRSTSAESAGEGAWQVRGELTLHGTTKPVVVEVKDNGGHYVGTANLKQSDYGIQPVKVAGGTVRVKDEIRIEFDIQPAR